MEDNKDKYLESLFRAAREEEEPISVAELKDILGARAPEPKSPLNGMRTGKIILALALFITSTVVLWSFWGPKREVTSHQENREGITITSLVPGAGSGAENVSENFAPITGMTEYIHDDVNAFHGEQPSGTIFVRKGSAGNVTTAVPGWQQEFDGGTAKVPVQVAPVLQMINVPVSDNSDLPEKKTERLREKKTDTAANPDAVNEPPILYRNEFKLDLVGLTYPLYSPFKNLKGICFTVGYQRRLWDRVGVGATVHMGALPPTVLYYDHITYTKGISLNAELRYYLRPMPRSGFFFGTYAALAFVNETTYNRETGDYVAESSGKGRVGGFGLMAGYRWNIGNHLFIEPLFGMSTGTSNFPEHNFFVDSRDRRHNLYRYEISLGWAFNGHGAINGKRNW